MNQPDDSRGAAAVGRPAGTGGAPGSGRHRRVRPVVRGVALVVAVVLALAGCATMPDSGPVTVVDAPAPEDDTVALIAYAPTNNATATQIVQGFLRAVAAGSGDEFAVAREYLAGPVAQTWNPRAQVRVYSARDEIIYTEPPNGAVRVTATASGSVDAQGRYTEASPDSVTDLDFSLAKGADGQWRIVALDDGILVSPAVFEAQYSSRELYFLAPDQEALVPEVRWFPERNSATQIVRNLLEGPSPWLAPGVTTAIPTGTTLVDDAVSVVDGVARVDLSPEVLAADQSQRALIVVQLEESLRTVRTAHSVRVTVVGSPLPPEASAPSPQRNLYVTGKPVVVSQGELFRFNGMDLLDLRDDVSFDGLDPRFPALPYEDAPGAPVMLDGTDRLVTVPTEDDAATVLETGEDLVAPSIDRLGWVWTTPRVSDGTVWTLRPPAGQRATVSAGWLAEASVRSLRISRDGARAVVISNKDGASQTDIAAVVRNEHGTPVGLGEPVRIGEMLTGANVAAWVDEETVAVLGTSGSDTVPSVHLVTVGGATVDLPAVEDAVTVTASAGDRSLLVGTADGDLYERNGLGWTLALTGVDDPAYPG